MSAVSPNNLQLQRMLISVPVRLSRDEENGDVMQAILCEKVAGRKIHNQLYLTPTSRFENQAVREKSATVSPFDHTIEFGRHRNQITIISTILTFSTAHYYLLVPFVTSVWDSTSAMDELS